MNRNLKFIIASIYSLCLCALIFVLFSYLDFKDLTSYSYLRNSGNILINFKNDNLILFTFVFFLASILWVFLLGFGTPVAILSGFIFGPLLGTAISVSAFTCGAGLLYVVAKYYFKDLVAKYLPKRIEKYKNLFNKNEFFYFMIFRISGGAGIPFAIQNILPVIFNMKLKNYLPSTFLGLVPIIFIINSLGSGIEQLLKNNETFNYISILTEKNIYLPLIGFFIIIIISYLIKKKYFKDN